MLMTSNPLHYYPKYETARKNNFEVNGSFKFHFCIETIRNYSRCLNNHIIPCLSPNKVENSLLQKCSHIASCWIQEYFHTKNISDPKCAQLKIWQLITPTGALYFTIRHCTMHMRSFLLMQLTRHNSLNITQNYATQCNLWHYLGKPHQG